MGFLSLLGDSLANLISGGELSRLRVDLARAEETIRNHPSIARANYLEDEVDRLRDTKEELTKAVSTLQDRLLAMGTTGGRDLHDIFPKVSDEDLKSIPPAHRALQRKKEATRAFAQQFQALNGTLPPARYRDVVVSATSPIVPSDDAPVQ